MGVLSEQRISELLAPYVDGTPHAEADVRRIVAQLGTYLDLLLRWNAKTNLTAIRDPEEIVRRHFGESIFTALQLQRLLPPAAEILDFGSGAGFPGLPIQLFVPEFCCTLAESQGKKAAFLREAVRSLGATAEIWAHRVEALPQDRKFQCVTIRAVDSMAKSVALAEERISKSGLLAILAGDEPTLSNQCDFQPAMTFPIPESDRRMLYLYARR